MLRYAARRLLAALLVLAAASALLFLMARLAPGDPAVLMAGGHRSSPETIAAARARYHLDAPLPAQFASWAAGVLRGDLGESFRLKESVSVLILDRLPVTLSLICFSILIAAVLALSLGTLAALHRGRLLDRAVNAAALVGLSVPIPLAALAGIYLFSYTLGWLPSLGLGSGPGGFLRSLILPSSALALNMLALSLRVTRDGVSAALESGYVRTARMKGVHPFRVVAVHALRNAAVPLLTLTGMQAGFLITGTVLVEQAFGIGGLGSLLVNGVYQSDYPVVQGVALASTAAFLLLNLAVDLLYALIDPRIRYA